MYRETASERNGRTRRGAFYVPPVAGRTMPIHKAGETDASSRSELKKAKAAAKAGPSTTKTQSEKDQDRADKKQRDLDKKAKKVADDLKASKKKKGKKDEGLEDLLSAGLAKVKVKGKK